VRHVRLVPLEGNKDAHACVAQLLDAATKRWMSCLHRVQEGKGDQWQAQLDTGALKRSETVGRSRMTKFLHELGNGERFGHGRQEKDAKDTGAALYAYTYRTLGEPTSCNLDALSNSRRSSAGPTVIKAHSALTCLALLQTRSRQASCEGSSK